MADSYTHLSYDEYKELERQCKAFSELETEHGEGTDFYHKSWRLTINGNTMEYHGPKVKARANGECLHPWDAVMTNGRTSQKYCGVCDLVLQ